MDQNHEYKASKYENLKKEMEKEGCSVIVKAVEIRAKGFVTGTLYQCPSQIGIKGRNRTKFIKSLIEIAEIVPCGYGTKKYSEEQFKMKIVKPKLHRECVTGLT